MARRRFMIELRDRTFVVRGWGAANTAADAGLRLVYNGAAQGFVGDRSRLPDLLAYLDHRRFAYVLDDPDQGGLWPDGGDAA